MTTAEKRAALQAQGEPWPDCDCHGEPMSWQRDPDIKAGGWFACRIVRRKWQQNRRAELVDAGGCVHCGTPTTDYRCQPCADTHADRMAHPKQAMFNRRSKARHRAKQREAEGFRPTGVGHAAFAAWMKEETSG